MTVLLTLLFIAATSIGASTPAEAATGLPCPVQVAKLRLCNATTDNYKDCYNAPDGLPETRTWLPFNQLRARGARWNIIAGQPQFGSTVRFRRISGRSKLPKVVVLHVRSLDSLASSVTLRTGPPSTHTGPLLTLRQPLTSGQRTRVQLSIKRTNGVHVAGAVVEYRYAATLAAAPVGSVEHNGPSGRWFVAGHATQTDWELGSGARC